MSADGPLQVIGAGSAGMILVLALCNRVAQRMVETSQRREYWSRYHGFQSYPLAIAPRIIECLTVQVAAEMVH